MMQGSLESQSRLRRYATWVVVLGSLLAASVVFIVDDRTTLRDFSTAVAAGLAATAIFAALVTWTLSAESDRLITGLFKKGFDEQRDWLIQELQHTNERYVPVRVYEATDSYSGNRFNFDLMAALKASGVYVFQGASAKYVSARIRYAGWNLSRVRILILNPEASVAIAARAADRAGNPRYAGKTVSEIQDLIRRETCRSIVALHESSKRVPIDIGLSNNFPAVQRVEILDDDIFVSIYNLDQQPVKTEFPTAYRYSRKSVIYAVNRFECDRLYELSARRLTLNSRTTDEEIIKIIKSLGMGDFSAAALVDMRAEAKTFEDDFLAALGMLS